MNYSTGTEGYYRKMLELQEKLRRSEEERMKLEEKFNETMRYSRDAEHERLRVLRHKYHRFLEEDRVRQDRNENILRALDRIESRAKTFAAKTDRFKALRKQYDAYIRRMCTMNHRQPEVDARAQQSSDSYPYQSYPNARKQLFATDVPATQRADTKIAMLEQYLQENFNSFPNPKTRDSLFNENQMFSRPNGFTAGYALPEKPSEDRNNGRQNYRQSETIVDSDSRDSQEGYNMQNGFPSRRTDSRLTQHENELVPKLPVKEQPKKTDKSELLGSTIEQELDRFRDKESVKQKTDTEVVKASTPDPYVQNYKDLVTKSAEKFGLHNGTLTKRTSDDQNIDSEDDEKLSSILKSKDPVNNKIIPDTTVQQREENKVNFAEHQENESPIIKETLKSEDVELNKEESVCEQQIVSNVKPTDDGEKLEIREQDDNVDVRSKTPEVSSARTEPPDDVTLTTPSPIHVPLPVENIATCKQESLGSDNKTSPVHLDEKLTESVVVQPHGVSKDLQNDNAHVIPQLPDIEQTESLNENIITENQKDETIVSEHYGEPNQGFDQNSPVEESLVEQQAGYDGLLSTDQPVYDNQDQVYQEEYQPQDGYVPQSYPVGEHAEAQPEVYDAEQYHMDPADQQQYAAAEEHYSIDQKQYPADQEHYGADQQQYPVDQEQYLVGQQEYPTDQQQYPADQYAVDEQHYSGTDAEQHYKQQEYPVDKEQYRQDQQYPTDQQEYPTDEQQEYPTDQEQYPVDPQQYPAAHHQQYVPDEQQYQSEYPPEQYSAEPQQYIEGQPADYDPTQYPPNYGTDQPYPQGEYEAEQYPDGYSQDVYRSEQEYLQGEQNIDLQYQTEVTGQEYPEEFANQESQPLLQEAGASEQDHQPQQSISPQQSSSEPVQRQQETSLPPKQDISESTEKSATKNVIQPEDGPLVEKKLPNLADMLDTDTESTKQETKVSNDSDFDFSQT